MNDLFLHDLGSKRIHWRYDDPSGIPDAPVRGSGKPSTQRGNEIRVRAGLQVLRIN